MHPKDLKIEDFTYDLPNEKIAYSPVNPRDSSKLLVLKNKEIQQGTYKNIAEFLQENSVLVFNNTKVIKSRIFFQNNNGATIEIFLLEPFGENINHETYFQKQESSLWTCLIGKASKWREKILTKKLEISGQTVELSAELVEKLPDSYVVKLSWEPSEISVGEIIDAAGVTPLPPYIKRIADKNDEDTYQTVYSEHEGSVAAPTAGLHFTNRVLEDLKSKNIPTLFTTLHVGAGTFKPVKADKMEDHHMHAEYMSITLDFLENLLQNIDETIIAVGTTSARTLESVFWMGNKIVNNPNIDFKNLKITQWEPYETEVFNDSRDAISAFIQWFKKNNLEHISVETEIIIAPGYQYKIVKGLVTNFHQPQSTLLLLVSALIGDDWKRLYQYAFDNDFRFLSYGDGSLLLP